MIKPSPPGRTTVALYVRVSTEEQAQGGFSIAGQIDKLQLACQLHDWSALPPYIDDGFSGKDMGRPAMKRLMDDAGKGLFSLIVVYKLDRLSRRLSDLVVFGDELEKMKIGIRSVTEAMDTSTSAGKLLFNLLGSFAQFEREMISERTRMGLGRRKKEGKWNGLPPFGYRTKKDGTLEIVSKDAPFARRVFELFLEHNLGAKLIARQLRREDGVTRRKGTWARNSVYNMLVNPAYAGLYRVDGELVKAPHEGIISRAEFEQIQEIMAGKNPTNARNHTSPNVLLGIIRCGLCGSGMTTGMGKKHYYYHCTGRARDNDCSLGWISAPDAEAAVIEGIQSVAGDRELIERCIKEQREKNARDVKALAAERLSLAKRLEGIERDKDRRARWLLEHMPDKTVSGELTRQLKAQLEEIEAIKQRQRELAARTEALGSDTLQAEMIGEVLGGFGEDLDALSAGQKRILIQGLVKEVVVRSKTDCEVVFTIPLPGLPHPVNGKKKSALPTENALLLPVPALAGQGEFSYLPKMG